MISEAHLDFPEERVAVPGDEYDLGIDHRMLGGR